MDKKVCRQKEKSVRERLADFGKVTEETHRLCLEYEKRMSCYYHISPFQCPDTIIAVGMYYDGSFSICIDECAIKSEYLSSLFNSLDFPCTVTIDALVVEDKEPTLCDVSVFLEKNKSLEVTYCYVKKLVSILKGFSR